MSVTSPPHIYRQPRDTRQQGFTLIELLMVIAVILILAGITFGISRGVQNAQARAKAKAELAVIAQALETFNSANGDYPWTDSQVELSKALLGWKKFNRSGDTTTFVDKDDVPASGPKQYIDPSKFFVSGTLPTTITKPTDLKFIDPWGREYVYAYKAPDQNKWNNFGYVLYSKGPDGKHLPVSEDGVVTPAIQADPLNRDNISASE